MTPQDLIRVCTASVSPTTNRALRAVLTPMQAVIRQNASYTKSVWSTTHIAHPTGNPRRDKFVVIGIFYDPQTFNGTATHGLPDPRLVPTAEPSDPNTTVTVILTLQASLVGTLRYALQTDNGNGNGNAISYDDPIDQQGFVNHVLTTIHAVLPPPHIHDKGQFI